MTFVFWEGTAEGLAWWCSQKAEGFTKACQERQSLLGSAGRKSSDGHAPVETTG